MIASSKFENLAEFISTKHLPPSSKETVNIIFLFLNDLFISISIGSLFFMAFYV